MNLKRGVAFITPKSRNSAELYICTLVRAVHKGIDVGRYLQADVAMNSTESQPTDFSVERIMSKDFESKVSKKALRIISRKTS
ncbi:hypothetical protein CEXT_448801 [Caerostris extrusa]|uniref:Uncharacterized protein n=1 Tax=Caerostris extrusa TaxID=172846 RepID=A0AAV4VA97_CAEEX|nr:hypothetical protein CEXT_448801 [Caerostris extrusa]